MPIWKCKVEGEICHKYDRALEIVNRLSISHSGSASLRKVWAWTRWTRQVSSGTTSPLQVPSRAGSPLLQPRHFYPQPGPLCYCLQLERVFEYILIFMMTFLLIGQVKKMKMLMKMAMMMNLVTAGSLNSSTGSSSLCRWWSTAEHFGWGLIWWAFRVLMDDYNDDKICHNHVKCDNDLIVGAGWGERG